LYIYIVYGFCFWWNIGMHFVLQLHNIKRQKWHHRFMEVYVFLCFLCWIMEHPINININNDHVALFHSSSVWFAADGKEDFNRLVALIHKICMCFLCSAVYMPPKILYYPHWKCFLLAYSCGTKGPMAYSSLFGVYPWASHGNVCHPHTLSGRLLPF